MRGAFKKKKAKVASVNHKRDRIALENIQRAKKDGTKVNVYFNASKVQIITLNVEDKKRLDALNKKINGKDKVIKENSGSHHKNSQNSLMDNSEKRILNNRITHKTEEKKKPEKKNASN